MPLTTKEEFLYAAAFASLAIFLAKALALEAIKSWREIKKELHRPDD